MSHYYIILCYVILLYITYIKLNYITLYYITVVLFYDAPVSHAHTSYWSPDW